MASRKRLNTENVIASNSIESHNVHKYDFRVLNPQEVKDTGTKESVFKAKANEVRSKLESSNPELANDPIAAKFKKGGSSSASSPEIPAPQPQPSVQASPQNQEMQENSVSKELVETLLSKADELSQSLARMQQQMENQQSEFNARVEEEKERAFKAGYDKGLEDTRVQMENGLEEIKQTMVDSIKGLDEAKGKFDGTVDNIEKELSSIAVDIAKEVVVSAISENSASIALELSKTLMDNVKEASKVVMKLNPADFEFVKNHMEEDARVKYQADKAIAKGGVVILSDSGNVDGTVMTRYQTLKTSILENRDSD